MNQHNLCIKLKQPIKDYYSLNNRTGMKEYSYKNRQPYAKRNHGNSLRSESSQMKTLSQTKICLSSSDFLETVSNGCSSNRNVNCSKVLLGKNKQCLSPHYSFLRSDASLGNHTQRMQRKIDDLTGYNDRRCISPLSRLHNTPYDFVKKCKVGSIDKDIRAISPIMKGKPRHNKCMADVMRKTLVNYAIVKNKKQPVHEYNKEVNKYRDKITMNDFLNKFVSQTYRKMVFGQEKNEHS